MAELSKKPIARMELSDKKVETFTVRASGALKQAMGKVAKDFDITISKLACDSLQNIFLAKEKPCAQGIHSFKSALDRLHSIGVEITQDGNLTAIEKQRFLHQLMITGNKALEAMHEVQDEEEVA